MLKHWTKHKALTSGLTDGLALSFLHPQMDAWQKRHCSLYKLQHLYHEHKMIIMQNCMLTVWTVFVWQDYWSWRNHCPMCCWSPLLRPQREIWLPVPASWRESIGRRRNWQTFIRPVIYYIYCAPFSRLNFWSYFDCVLAVSSGTLSVRQRSNWKCTCWYASVNQGWSCAVCQ